MGRAARSRANRDLFGEPPNVGFGPSRFHVETASPIVARFDAKSTKRFHRHVRLTAPKVPGVYGMLDQHGRVIYVGKAKNLRARLMSYFRESSDPKAARIFRHTRTLVWEHAADELGAFLRELELIRRFRPRFNVLGQPGRQRYRYLCLGRGPAATVFITREPTGKELGIYGPFVGRGRLQLIAKRLNDYFRLRDCPSTVRMTFADDTKLFDEPLAPKCLRHELNFCSGPCAAMVDRASYQRATRQARRFLDGEDEQPLRELELAMKAAAAALQFEKASAFRDRLQDLEWLTDRLRLLRSSRNQKAFVYVVENVWYLLNRGQVQAAVAVPSDPASRSRTADVIELVANCGPMGVGKPCVDSVLLVASWFRKRPTEMSRLRPADEVIAELRQLNQDREAAALSVTDGVRAS